MPAFAEHDRAFAENLGGHCGAMGKKPVYPHLTHWVWRDMARVGAPRNRAFSVPLEVTKATTRIAKNTTELRKIGKGGAWEGM